MKKSKAMKLVNALRSGKYKQGQTSLHHFNNDTYCILGIAGKVFKNNPQFGYDIFDQETTNLLWNLNDLGVPKDEVIALTFDELADFIQMDYKNLNEK